MIDGHILDDPYRKIIIWACGSWEANALFNIIGRQLDINKIYLYAKDSYEVKYQFLINEREDTGLKYLKDSKAFIEYPNDMDDIYEDIEQYNTDKEHKILIIFDNMIADLLINIKLNPIVTELFIRGR